MKWYLGYVQKLKPPSTPAQNFGSCFHMAVEYYIRSGGETLDTFEDLKVRFVAKYVDKYDEDEIAKTLKLKCTEIEYKTISRLVRNAKKKLQPWIEYSADVELEIKGSVIEGVDYIGYIDLRLINHAAKEILIFDHKTTSNFKYCETPETLVNDIQIGMYCRHTRKTLPDLAEYKLFVGHIQYLKKSPNEVRSAKAKMLDKHIDMVWERIQDASAKMLLIKESFSDDFISAMRGVKQNLNHCNKYRTKTSPGCAFQAVCHGGMSVKRLRENFDLEKKAMENLDKPVSPLQAASKMTAKPFKQQMEGI